MKTIIAGSRDITDARYLITALNCVPWSITELVSGGARGVDSMGEAWALSRDIPVKLFPADWDGQGRAAGPIRNTQMADYADALLAIWDGRSRGTEDMITKARARGLQVKVAVVHDGQLAWLKEPEKHNVGAA